MKKIKWTNLQCEKDDKCTNPVLEGSKRCEKHKARRGTHRKTFLKVVKERVASENFGNLVCEGPDCKVKGVIEIKEHWFDVDHIKEINEFGPKDLLDTINSPDNGQLLCKFCHADKNIKKRPKKK